MRALENLADIAERTGLEFIVCGGHAVNAYQVIRKTGDIDLLVRERDSRSWKEQLLLLGYSVFHESGAFLQLHAATPTEWPVDLVFVDDRTFDTITRAGKKFQFAGTTCIIPSIEHLLAMKLHALKFSGERRMRKDAVDIVDLAEKANIDLEGEMFRALWERFANRGVYERILDFAGKKPQRNDE